MSRADTRLTIVDIAPLRGVSKSTVPRVLSGVDGVVASSGYRRNDLARSLRSGRTGMLGLPIPDIANPWAEVGRGAQDAASERGQTLLIFNSDWELERKRSDLRALTRSRVDGAIVNPVQHGLDEIAHLDIPLVRIGSTAARFPHVPSVREGMRRLLARVRPDVVFAANDLMALGALPAARGVNLSCPGDVAILGSDGNPAGNFAAPRLSTVVKPAREIGTCAFALLAARIEVREAVRQVTLPTSICERESLPNSCSYARLRAV